jgi:hypothetical protein
MPVFSTLWSNITAYILIALGVRLIYMWFKQMLAAKLVEKDPFGRAEFYLGMMAGVVRFRLHAPGRLLALMNSHVITAAELAQTKKFQKSWFSDIRFPTYGEFQQDVLFKSFTGNLVEANLKPHLIASVNSSQAECPRRQACKRGIHRAEKESGNRRYSQQTKQIDLFPVMGGFFTPATLEQIRAASDIVEIIGSYIPLKRNGANFVALCPFHREKTPSFNVSANKQIFHCFGCHKGGDVFHLRQGIREH